MEFLKNRNKLHYRAVIPAKAGIFILLCSHGIPAYAGMTESFRVFRKKSLAPQNFRLTLYNQEKSLFVLPTMVTFMDELTKTQHGMKYVVVFNSNGMGNATPDLSQLLATNYLKLLSEENHLPAAILFYAEGVKLCCEGSGVTDSLKQLENKGVKLIACTTCLNYYNIKDKLVVGNIGTMADIMMYQIHTGKVITV